MNTLLELGILLSSKRKKAKMSLKSLARECGMSDSTLSLVERGKAKAPSFLQVCNVANVLNIQPSELFEAMGYQTVHMYKSTTTLKNINSLTDEEIKTVQLFIDFLISQRTTEDEEIASNDF